MIKYYIIFLYLDALIYFLFIWIHPYIWSALSFCILLHIVKNLDLGLECKSVIIKPLKEVELVPDIMHIKYISKEIGGSCCDSEFSSMCDLKTPTIFKAYI